MEEEDPTTDNAEASAVEVDELEEDPKNAATAPNDDNLDQVTPGDIQIQAAPPLSEAELDAKTSQKIAALTNKLRTFLSNPVQQAESAQDASRAVRNVRALATPRNIITFRPLRDLVQLADDVDRLLSVEPSRKFLSGEIRKLIELAEDLGEDQPVRAVQALNEALRLSSSPRAELDSVTDDISDLLSATDEIDPNKPDSIKKLRKTLLGFAAHFVKLRAAVLQNNLHDIQAEARWNSLQEAATEARALIVELERNGTTISLQQEFLAVELLRREFHLLREAAEQAKLRAAKPTGSPANKCLTAGVCLALGLSAYNFIDDQKPTVATTVAPTTNLDSPSVSAWTEIQSTTLKTALGPNEDRKTAFALLQDNLDAGTDIFLVANCAAKKVFSLVGPEHAPLEFDNGSRELDGYAPLDQSPRELCEKHPGKIFTVAPQAN
jgi:hypothetical protein